MLGIYTESITRVAGISSDTDVRVRESIERNLKIDAAAMPADTDVSSGQQARTTPGHIGWMSDFFQLTTNRFLI